MPRQGKKRRLDSFRPDLKIRSVYDHILSVAHSADCLLSSGKLRLQPQDFGTLALCIAFHELNEVVLGDIPSYTSLRSAGTVRWDAESRLRGVAPPRREQIASDFVWLFLSEKHRVSAHAVDTILANTKSDIFLVFKLLDKLDPIVAVWRYLHHFRGKLGDTPKEFNSAMKDFFENPDVKAYIKTHKFDNSIYELVTNLQDRSKAWNYYMDRKKFFQSSDMFGIDRGVVERLVEGIPLFHISGQKKVAKNLPMAPIVERSTSHSSKPVPSTVPTGSRSRMIKRDK